MAGRTLTLILASLLVTACGAGDETEVDEHADGGDLSASPEAGILATINGERITAPMLDMHMARRSGGRPDRLSAEDRETLLLELVEMELIAQDAEERGIGESDHVQAQVNNIRRAVLVQARIEQLRREPVDDETLHALYDRLYARQRLKEYHARHILVDSADEAQTLIAALDSGADFAELARQHSTGPSAPQGGDLGWFTPDQMVEAFARSAVELDQGDYTREPVRTEFGWHVIRLEARRNSDPPPFDKIKDRLRAEAISARIEAYVMELRKSSDVMLFRHPE
ncbi:MAG: peptidylprolyl isomerase [Aquisalimonadaceae bacterium]